MEIFKIVAVGILICVVTLILKQVKPELSVTVVIAGSVILITYALSYFSTVFQVFGTIVNKTGIDQGLFTILLKLIGVGYLVEFGASICEDTGNSSIANKIVLCGKITIFIMAMPIITSLFHLILDLLWWKNVLYCCS